MTPNSSFERTVHQRGCRAAASFVVCFAVEPSGAARAAECRAAIERLCPNHESLSGAEFGQAEGELLVTLGPQGHLSSMPWGSAMSEAWKQR